MRPLHLPLLVCFVIVTAAAGTGSAATWVVKPDSTGDAPTIQAGIDSASAGDTVLVSCGTYHEHAVQIKSGICLASELRTADCVTIDADTLGRVFRFANIDSTTSIVGFTAINGLNRAHPGGGIYCEYCDARFVNCTFRDNHSDYSGGGAYIYRGSPVFTECLFSSNTVIDTSEGGGVRVVSASTIFIGCTFSANHAPAGCGGGLYYSGHGDPVLTDCLFELNTATAGGGALLYLQDSTAVVSNCTFRDNSATEGPGGSGGAMRLSRGGVEVSECTFEGNSAWGGGGIFSYDCSAIITDCVFRENTVTIGGGGFSCEHGYPVVTDCEFYDNHAVARGGGAVVSFYTNATFDHCVFAGNTVSRNEDWDGGGGLGVCYDGSTQVYNCTFYGNDGAGSGGVIFASFDSPATLDNCIIAFAPSGGAVSLYFGAPAPVFTCCDIYGNVGGDWAGPIADQYGINGNISADPLFVDPEEYDLHLASGSPCIDPGGCGLMGAYGWAEGFIMRSVTDVLGDQGGFLDLEWGRISFDSPESDTTVDGYTIWRRVDTPEFGGSGFEVGRLGGLVADPPGTWELIDSVAATGQPTYSATCPTVCDSTVEGVCWSVFFVKVHCSEPSLEVATQPDSGYSVDNTGVEGWTDVTTGVLGHSGPGSGLAWVDYDTDGDFDLYFTNRETDANVLLRNDDLTAEGFVDATPPVLADPANSRGCPWGDYDNDGDPDLYVSIKGANKLIRNDGGGSFVDVTTAPLGDAGTGQAAAWADYDNDGDLDLYIVNNGTNRLFRNDGAAVFADVTVGPLGDAGWGIGMAWGDYDDDGDMDIYLANYDHTANVLLANEGGGVFTDATTPVLAIGLSSYGAAWGDYDNDGDLDLYVVNEGPNNLLRNDGGTFTDVTVSPLDNDVWGRSAAWGDYNLDGHLDLYLVSWSGDNRLFRNQGDGSFVIPACRACPLEESREPFSAAWADYDQDGDLDLYVVNDIDNKLFRNELGPGRHWLEIDPVGVISNADGVGARVRIVAGGASQMREIAGASGFASQGPLTAWFGLGTETVVDTVEVTWPASGIVQTMTDVACDQTVEVVEDDLSGFADKKHLPAVFRLHPSRPNPFSALTAIRYDLPEASHVDLAVYDVSGRVVRSLLTNQQRQPGYHTVYWNGRNGNGRPVAPGVYFCRLSAGSYTGIERMLLLR